MASPVDLKLAALRACAAAAPDSLDVANGLKMAASDENELMRVGAADALGRLKPMPPSAATALANMMRTDRTFRVRQVAVKALALASPPAKGVRADLEAVSKGPKDDLSFWAQFALATFESDPTKKVPIVRAGLKDRLPTVRAAALDALPMLGTPQAEDLPQLMKLLKDNSLLVRARAAAAIGKYGAAGKDAVPLLLRSLAVRDRDVQIATIEALGAIGPAAAAAVPKLRASAKDDEPAVARAAKDALEKIAK